MNSTFYTFENNNRSFIIRNPNGPPRAWENKLWNEDGYQVAVTHTGMSSSTYLNSNMDLNEITNGNAKFFYIRDDVTGECWSPSCSPLNETLDSFECEHNLAWTEFRASKNARAVLLVKPIV